MSVKAKKMQVSIIRYSTHSCLDSNRKRKIVRYPGVLIYNRRCAIIATRLRKRDSRKKKRNWLYNRLMLPPKRIRRKRRSKNVTANKVPPPVQTIAIKKAIRELSCKNITSVVKRGVAEKFDAQSSSEDHRQQQINVSKGEQLVKPSPTKNISEDSQENAENFLNEYSHEKNGVILEPMPMSEWKIIFTKKGELEKEVEDERTIENSHCGGGESIPEKTEESEIIDGKKENNLHKDTGKRMDGFYVYGEEKSSNDNISKELPPVLLDQWQYIESELPDSKTNPFVWRFPKLPNRMVVASTKRGILHRRKYPMQTKALQDSLFSFEVLAHKVVLQPRPVLWAHNESKHATKSNCSELKLNVIDLSLGIPSLKNETRRNEITFNPKTQSDMSKDLLLNQDLSPVLEINSSKLNGAGTATDGTINQMHNMQIHLQNPVVKNLLVSKKWGLRPRSSKFDRTTSSAPKGQNTIVRNIVKTKQWVSRPISSAASECSKQQKSNSLIGGSSGEEESLFIDDKPKPQRKRKKSSRRKKKEQEKEREMSAKSGPLEGATDLLDSDIFAELMKLYSPRDTNRNSASASDGTYKKRKKKRKRTASKKKNDAKNSLREDLLVSLKRNTAYWYEVTSRLQTVSEQPKVKVEDDLVTNSNSKTGKKLKEAVHKAFPKLKKKDKTISGDASNQLLSTSLPSIDQKPQSKFYKAAAAMVNAERNYYNFLPPLKPSWSDALEDIFPALVQDSEDSGLGGEKKAGKKKPKRGGKKKGEEGGLDDPGQTAVSTVSDSRAGSSKRSSGSPHSSKPTSARSSKSSSAHRRMHDPLSYDPKQFLGDNHPPEDESELAKLQEALGGGGAANLTDAEVFWFHLPRSPSHRAAIFTLPVQIKRLKGLGPVDYLKKYMRLRTSRKQLYSMVFTKHRDMESIRIERMLVSDFEKALGDALGGHLTDVQLERLTTLVPLPEGALDKDFFILIAAFAERLLCYELLAAQDVEIEPRDLVEQLDFQQLDERLEEVSLDPKLHHILTTIRDLG